ncbi:MAG: flagellar hook-basal body complex protein [Chitinispirillia bacterium]|nr:flagellar hook-basal body complex protein [Chitinispirillia bacterium]
MVRSLYAGISGLRSHQVALDVTGNNIANVNTIGFKSGRATFKESMAQMLQGPSRPAGNQSGTNPLQIGLGTSIGSIDTMLRQGNMQTTGQITDLAIEGRAYFAFSNGSGTFYSRNGGLHLDADGYLVSPTTGWRLQGKMADTFGNYGAGTGIGDLRIPWGEKAPARATTEVQFGCNLNSDSQERGTITHTNSFLRSAALGTGAALSEVQMISDFYTIPGDPTTNTLRTITGNFIAVNEVTRLENGIASAYGRVETHRSSIMRNRETIGVNTDLLNGVGGSIGYIAERAAAAATLAAAEIALAVDPTNPALILARGNAEREFNRLDELVNSLVTRNTELTADITDLNDRIRAYLNDPVGSTHPDVTYSIPQMQTDLAILRPIVAGQRASAVEAIADRTLLTSLFDDAGNSLGIKGGDIITMETGDKNFPAFKFTVLRDSDVLPEDDPNYPHVNYPLVGRTLDDFRKAMEGYLNALERLTFTENMSNKVRTDMMNDEVRRYVEVAYPRPDGLRSPNPANVGAITIDYNTDGSFRITNDTGNPDRIPFVDEFQIPRFGVSSSRPGSGYLANVFSFPQPIHSLHATERGVPIPDPNDPFNTISGDVPNLAYRARGVSNGGGILIPAVAGPNSDRISDIFNARGQLLNLKDGDDINISGTIGARSRRGGLEYNDELTLEDLLTEMQNAYNLPPTDGTIYQRPSISIKQAGDGFDETIPLGSIVLRGMPGRAFELEGLSVMAKDNNISDPPPPTAFSTNMQFATVQHARDAEIRRIEGKVYDESGAEHIMVTTFIPLQEPGEWMWEITMTGEQRVLGGNTGKIIFGVNGTPSSFLFDDNTNSFRFDPMNGASQVDIKIDSGAPGSKEGITQYKSATTTEFKAQDGYPMGKLEEIFIDERGEIAGKYTNGITKAIAQIMVAEFNNPAGLLKTGNSMFAVSPNSGQAVLHQPGVGTPSTIKPGALEMSNVELETEFTNMITIQRGYQANARIITTSDSMLQELVQLVR